MGKRNEALVVLRSARLLVFDPDAAHLASLVERLRHAGYRVAAVEQLDSVRPMAEAFRPDAYIVDAVAPSMVGLALARELKQARQGASAILAMSSDASVGPACLAEHGADDFLVKPVAGHELLARLRARLRTRLELNALSHAVSESAGSSIADPLTRLFNRRYFHATLEHELKRGARFGTPFTVAALDVVGFRTLCAQLGADAGERIQKDIASWLRANLRESDLAARVGPGRFGILMPGTSEHGAVVARARLLGGLNQSKHLLGDARVTVNVQVGMASFPLASPRSPQKLFEHAVADVRRHVPMTRN